MPAAKSFDLVVFGATSFVGQILCRYLHAQHGTDGTLRWALAGRSQRKLEEVRAALGPGAGHIPLIIADAADETALRAMCAQTRVVVSTVGPYALYGSPLVKVCAEDGIDYCDLTGEVQWIDRMIRAHEATARRSGARIVHCCGFDSIPSDLGVHYTQQVARAAFGEPCDRIGMRVHRIRGGASGGTIASMINAAREIAANPAMLRALANPYLIAPENPGVRQPGVAFAAYDARARSWIAPFVMSAINTRVVHRSNGLCGWGWGRGFRYDEAMSTGPGLGGALKAAGIAVGLGAFFGAAGIPPLRWAMERFMLPKPGEGPGPEAQAKGFFVMRFFGTTPGGRTVTAQVSGDRDPGYGSTAKMLGEAAVCLAQDVPDAAGGFWTPASLFGDALLQRLQARSGLKFETL